MNEFEPVDEKETRVQSRRVMKNLLVFCFSFFFQNAAVNALSNLQSTLNGTLGVRALLVSWALNPISALLIPNLLLKYFNYKWIIVFAQLCFTAFTLANMFPSYFTLIPASFMMGLSGRQVGIRCMMAPSGLISNHWRFS